jgi:hypothetical protein
MDKRILSSILIILACFSCAKDKAPVTQDDIPITVGSTWKYLYASYYGDSDTMFITALSKVASPSGNTLIMMQRKTSLFGTDTVYASITSSSITYYSDIEMNNIADKYLLPLKEGLGWSDRAHSFDTTWVVGYPGQIKFYGLQYDSIYSTRREASDSSGFNLIGLTFVKPGIGIVYQTISQYSNYQDGYTLYLTNYNIVK